MKGAGFSWIFGILMVLVVTAVFVTGVVKHFDTQTTIVSGAVEVYDNVHTAEFVKRTLDGASYLAGPAVSGTLSLEGGGYPTWYNNTPVMDDFTAKLGARIAGRMDLIKFDGLNGREIKWSGASAKITDFADDSFFFSGNKSFTVESKVAVPQVKSLSSGGFAGAVSTPYFKLLRVGRIIATCPPNTGVKEYEKITPEFTALEGNKFYIELSEPAGYRLNFTLDCSTNT